MAGPTDAELLALADLVARSLLAAGQRLATAESCTGGWIAKACTDLAGSSRWFVGSVVAYADDAKLDLLGVDPGDIVAQGAVSQGVVTAMAVGALRRFDADIAVAVSGIAGPDGGTVHKPVGTVWFGWARRRNPGAIEAVTAMEVLPGDRESIRRCTVRRALAGLLEGQ